jgi:alkylation response protein AidB-like acyl-CoA dehydrogenase
MYRAPLQDLKFALEEVLGMEALAECPDFSDVTPELAGSVLQEAARLAEGVLDPLYAPADREGAHWSDDGVATPKGFKAAYQQFVSGGWPQLRAAPAFGGQGMPAVLVAAVEELFASANLAFRLCPMLTQGATEAIAHCGSAAQKELYLPPMVRGEWTGTMNLTEPQAGSDLSQVRTRAVPQGNHYRIFGQKIFITYGEHDLAANIIHLVLARIEGAPAGVRGISLFIVPKFLVGEDGSVGARNDLKCVSIEHKLGIRGSPTCTMIYGQGDGAVGYLLGEANRGLEYMFIMMNAARLSVGLEGYAVAERAYQRALDWARNRVQGRPPGPTEDHTVRPITHHPDVRRMLLTMKSQIEAMRYLTLYTAIQLDLGAHHGDLSRRLPSRARGELLIPIVKGWCTETGVELASLGIQVHGGMGYIEETGAAQALRDARISTIYEGTTGIQAGDLIGRKLARDGGAAFASLAADIHAELASYRDAAGAAEPAAPPIVAAADAALVRLEEVVANLLGNPSGSPAAAAAVAVPLLRLAGITFGGWLQARAAVRASILASRAGADRRFLQAKLQTARFYAEQILPLTVGLAMIVREGAGSVLDSDPELL